MLNFLDYSLQISGSFLLIYSIGRFIKSHKEKNSIFLSIVFLSSAITILDYTILGTGKSTGNVFNLSFKYFYRLITIPLPLLIGPSLYYHFLSVTKDNYTFTKKNYWHFMVYPAIVLMNTIIISLSYIFDNQKILVTIYLNIQMLIRLPLFIYGTFALINLLKFKPKSFTNNAVIRFISLFMISVLIFVSILLIVDIDSKGHLLILVSLHLVSTILLAIYFTELLYPNYLQKIGKEIKEEKYKKTRIKGLNKKVLKDRVTQLMEYEKLYITEDINLSFLAEKLELTTHQLSEFINTEYKLNFNDFINNYRVTEAKKLLIQTDYTIIQIAFDSGFNSKSSFQRAFIKHQTELPTAYRKNNKM